MPYKFMYKFSVFILLVLVSSACERWNLEEVAFIEITSEPVVISNFNEAFIESEIKKINGNLIIQHGHVWSSTLENPTILINDGIDNKGGRDTNGKYSSNIDDLETNTTYFIRGFAQTDNRISYGPSITFSTGNIQLTSDSLVYIDARSFTAYGSLCCTELGITIDQHGFCWSSIFVDPTIENSDFVTLGKPDSNGLFSAVIDGLADNTSYSYRSYAITNFGSEVVYGDIKTAQTNLRNIWKKKANIPAYGFFQPGFAYNGKGYVFAEDRFWMYDPISNTWTPRPPKPGPELFEPVEFVIDDYAYLMIGTYERAVPDRVCWRFDLINNQWEELSLFPGTARIAATGFAPGNGKGYAGIGEDYLDFWEYDPSSDSWTQKSDYPDIYGRANIMTFVLEGFGYIGGGAAAGLENFNRYDHQTDTWIPKNTLPGGEIFEATTFVIDQTAYMGTGASFGNASTKTFWKYDQFNDSWSEITDFAGEARFGAFGFSIGDKGYVGGGIGTEEYTNFFQYKPEKD